MSDKESIAVSVDASPVLNSERIYLSLKGSIALTRGCFYQPMYTTLSEVLNLAIINLERTTRKKVDYTRTFRGGAVGESEWVPASYVGFEVEEYFVFEERTGGRNLLFRVRPFFFSQNKRIECKIYKAGQGFSELISLYLGIWARMNHAKLVVKD
jgi:hypothetical protein